MENELENGAAQAVSPDALNLLARAASEAAQAAASAAKASATIAEALSLLNRAGVAPEPRPDRETAVGAEILFRESDRATSENVLRRERAPQAEEAVAPHPFLVQFTEFFEYMRTNHWRVWNGRPGDLRDFSGRTLKAFFDALSPEQREPAKQAIGNFLVTRQIINQMDESLWKFTDWTFLRFFSVLVQTPAESLVWDRFRPIVSIGDPTLRAVREARAAERLTMRDIGIAPHTGAYDPILTGLMSLHAPAPYANDFTAPWASFLSDPFASVVEIQNAFLGRKKLGADCK